MEAELNLSDFSEPPIYRKSHYSLGARCMLSTRVLATVPRGLHRRNFQNAYSAASADLCGRGAWREEGFTRAGEIVAES